ncbi:hypothetical protein GQ457_02G000860 [Hibiscus cannabinus]
MKVSVQIDHAFFIHHCENRILQCLGSTESTDHHNLQRRFLDELVLTIHRTPGNHQLLPQGCEATVDIPFNKIQYLQVAYDLLRHPAKQFVMEKKQDWILADVIPHWVVEIAQEHQVPLLHFSIFSAAAYSFILNPRYVGGDGQEKVRPSPESLTSPPDWFDIPSPLCHGPRVWARDNGAKSVRKAGELCSSVERRSWKILGHPSIGRSLFHSGWGSIIETLQFGHSLVVLPFVINQSLNTRLLVDKGLAVEIDISEDGSFSRDDMAKALRLAMLSEEGDKLRIRAKESAQLLPGGLIGGYGRIDTGMRWVMDSQLGGGCGDGFENIPAWAGVDLKIVSAIGSGLIGGYGRIETGMRWVMDSQLGGGCGDGFENIPAWAGVDLKILLPSGLIGGYGRIETGGYGDGGGGNRTRLACLPSLVR